MSFDLNRLQFELSHLNGLLDGIRLALLTSPLLVEESGGADGWAPAPQADEFLRAYA